LLKFTFIILQGDTNHSTILGKSIEAIPGACSSQVGPFKRGFAGRAFDEPAMLRVDAAVCYSVITPDLASALPFLTVGA
jgi:hypothetical protein